MRIKFVLFFCMLSYLGVAQSQLESNILKGLDYFYNFQFEKAEQKFNEVIKKFPNKPHGYHFLAQMHLWIYIGCKNEKHFSDYINFSNLAIEKANKILEKEKNNYDVKYILASSHLLRVLSAAQKEPNFDAIGDTKIATNLYEEIIEAKPNFYDAYLGLGIFDYALSYVPGLYKWGLEMIGLSADKERGLDYIKKTYLHGKYAKAEAGFHLSNIYSDYLANYNEAIKVLKNLTLKYPNNSLFRYQLASIYIKAKQFNDADKSLDMVIKNNEKNFIQTIAYSYFLKGQIAFFKNNFNAAVSHYEKFLSMTLEPNYTGIANYNLAISNLNIGNEKESKKNFKNSCNGNLDISDDYYAEAKSKYFIENEITEEDIFIIRIKNLFEFGKFKEVLKTLVPKLDSLKNSENKNIANYLIGESSYQLKKYDDAINYCMDISSNNIEVDNWVIPFGALTIAKSYFGKKDYEKSADWLDLCERNNIYVYKEKLEPFILNLKLQLEKKYKSK